MSLVVSPEGWNYLEDHARKVGDRTQAFVAMSFSEDMKPIWENAIKPAITRAGYIPLRVDIEPHVERIDVRIISEINRSRFIVADVTQQKQGVYFEAGYALGKEIPVIWCVQREDAGNVHFDTDHFNHVRWNDADEFREKLYEFICAVIGERNIN